MRKEGTTKNSKKFSAPAYIPLFDGRPERENWINGDDILNLNIALNTARTIDEFLLTV